MFKANKTHKNKYLFGALFAVFSFTCAAKDFSNSPQKPLSAEPTVEIPAEKISYPKKSQSSQLAVTKLAIDDQASANLPIDNQETTELQTKLDTQLQQVEPQADIPQKIESQTVTPQVIIAPVNNTEEQITAKKSATSSASSQNQQSTAIQSVVSAPVNTLTTVADVKPIANNTAVSEQALVTEQPVVAEQPLLTELPPVTEKSLVTAQTPVVEEKVEENEDFIETAYDLFVGGNYFGFVLVKYNNDWIELLDPQEAIYMLPLIRNRQAMLPLFQGRIYASRNMDTLGTISIDNDNFAIMADIAPEQALDVAVEISKTTGFEGSPTFLTRLEAKGSRTLSAEQRNNNTAFTNHTRLAYRQHRLLTSGSYVDSYDLRTLQAETDFTVLETPLTLAGGLLDTPGQLFASSLDIVGASISSNRELYSDDPQLKSNQLEVFVPTRALVEVFKEDAESGEVLFSRMLEFGHTQLDSRRFPRGSYPVVIVISVDGVETARYTEQFYKYEEIMPRERLDLNFSLGKLRDNLDYYSIPVLFTSVRARITDYLEGSASMYAIDDRMIFSQGIKGIYQAKDFGEFNFDLSLSESNSKTLLGYWANLRWRGEHISSSLSYSQAFKDDPVLSDKMVLLDFKAREILNFSLSRNFKLGKRNLYFAFKGQYRNNPDTPDTYRYGPAIRYIPYRNKNTYVTVTAQHDWTDIGEQTRFFIGLTYRLGNVTATSYLNGAKHTAAKSLAWENSVQYRGDDSSVDTLRNITAKALYRTSKISSDTRTQNTQVKNLDLDYDGTLLKAGMYLNKTSTSQGGSFGGELVSTFVAGSDQMIQMTGAVPIGSALVAIKINGQPDSEKLISVLVNGNHKAYINIGETTFIEAREYKESTIEIRDANPKQGAFIKIMNPHTSVTPYPGNSLSRSFDIARLIILSGTLVNADDSPVANLFFETGSEAAYTDNNGEFIVEMPIRVNDNKFTFIVKNQVCRFEIPKVKQDMLIEVGEVKCKLTSALELDKIRLQHDKTRIY